MPLGNKRSAPQPVSLCSEPGSHRHGARGPPLLKPRALEPVLHRREATDPRRESLACNKDRAQPRANKSATNRKKSAQHSARHRVTAYKSELFLQACPLPQRILC